MKVTLLSTILILLVFGLSAQTHRCAFDSTHAYRNRTNPDNKKELRNFMLESKKQAALLPKKDPVSPSKRLNPYAPGYADYVIPIVVHVIHNGGASNISDAQINNQVNELNGYFQPYGIQFCLAKIMPDGTPFNGITRRNHALSKYRLNLDEAALMNLDLFPRDKYLNIWVVDTILDDNGVNRNQIGAGSYPDERKLGVVIRHDFFGNDVTCGSCALNPAAQGKTLVHELGHFFGLLHTHENGCAGNEANTCDTAGDFICDTPPMLFVNFTCRDTNTCKEKPNDRTDPIHNYMSYKAETCLNEFTVQQMEIIKANIEVYLETLIDPTNIKLVGGDSCGYITALFNASNTLICGSGSVTFKALDSVPSSRTYNWIITRKNGSLVHSYSSSSSMLTYNFTVPDEYTITLEVNGLVGNIGIISRTRKAYVKVINCGNKIISTRGNWYFGEYAGLEFKQNATIPDKNSYDGNKALTEQNLNSIEGCIVQNNNIGQLLFYGGGKRIGNNIDSFYIFDKNHNPMPHGRVLGTSTSSYGGVVVPVPGSKKRYYLFTTNIQNFVTTDHYGCRWSIIDTSLNGNNGDVDTNYMNKPLKAAPGRSFNPIDSAAYTGEGICAIPGCDSSSYWLIVNATKYTGAANDSTVLSRYIEVYKITASGITHHYQWVAPQLFWAYGSIVASPDGRYISNCGMLFLFNRKTGALRLLNNFQDKNASTGFPISDQYHARFSPDSRILYILRHKIVDESLGLFSKELRQYDLSTDGAFAAKTTLKENAHCLQNGPDGKMYIAQYNDQRISYVEKPNNLNDFVSTNNIDLKSDKIHLKLGLVTMRSMGGLPNFIDAGRQIDVAKKIYHRITDCNKIFFYTNQCCATSYSWDFGDGGSASKDTAWHQYTGKRDSFFITLVADGITLYDTIRFGFSGTKINGDTTICDTSNFNMYYAHNAKPGKYKYLWSAVNGGIRSNTSLTYAETKWSAPGTIKLILTDKYGCKDTATRTSAFGQKLDNNVITNPNSCSIDSLFGTKPTGGNGKYRYYWEYRLKGASDWTYADSFKNILPKVSSGSREFRRIVYSGGCFSISNVVVVVSLQNLNKIQKFVTDSNGNRCYTRLIGEDIGAYYPGVTYQWQESLDNNNWSNMSGKTSNFLGLNLSTEIRYYRLRAIYSTCTTYSNVVQGNQLIIERQPKDFLYCKTNDSFPILFEFKVSQYNINSYLIEWQRRHPGGGTQWVNVGNGLTEKDTFIYIKQQTTDPIVNGDSFRFRLSNIGCGVSDYTYSSVVRFRRVDSVKITKQPSDTTVSPGGRIRLKVWVNSLSNCSFSWQASRDTINWTNLSETDKDSLVINPANYCQDSVYYRAVLHHPCNTKYSRPAFVKVTGASKPSWDLWMKDRTSDNGAEPGDSSDWARSVDLWIRWDNDGVKPTNLSEQEIGTNFDTNWVYATVRNKGAAYSSGPGKLYLYWTWASTGELWDRSWTYNSKNVYSNGKPMGGQINMTPIQIQSLANNSSYNIAYPWTDFPRMGWYDLSNTWYRNKMNVCLLARIQTCEEPKFGMTYKEKTDIKYNVNRNNNIVTRNTWVKYIWIPGRDSLPTKDTLVYDPDGSNGGGQTEFHLRPDITDGGIIKVRNTGTSGTITVCISTASSGYFTKADIFVELAPNLMEAVNLGASTTGLQWVEGNIYKITSTNACFEGIPVYEDFEGDMNFYFAYKDVNSTFAANDKYVFAIQQFDENDREVGQCWLEIMDNPLLTPRNTVQNVSVTACDWDMSGGIAQYTVPYPELPHTVYDEQEEDFIEVNESGTYELVPGNYIITSEDEINNEVIVTNLTVNWANPTPVNSIDTVWYDCDNPDSVDYVKTCENGIMYDMFDQVVSESSPGHYTIDPQEPWYTFVCADSANCIKYSTQLQFMDIIQVPSSTSNYLTGMYNRHEHPCCFIDLTEAECDGETPLTFGQEIQVYDMNADFLYQTNLELYGGTVLGFRFCPPQWDTGSNVISNWYSIVIRNDECSFCRMDFMCDSVGDPEPFVILNYPYGKLTGSVSQINEKANVKGAVSGTGKQPADKLPTSASVYPNPAASEVNVKVISTVSANLTVQINDAAGKPVYIGNFETVNNSLSAKIDLSGLASGIYTVYIPQLNYYYKLVIIR